MGSQGQVTEDKSARTVFEWIKEMTGMIAVLFSPQGIDVTHGEWFMYHDLGPKVTAWTLFKRKAFQ